ncbi:CaiB/BaiF CoA transferase family protein [Hufsiella ginkgonis]|uniref:CoA transferase n=1 Tax=Hufsiella ginkgonis TaxID=2695274 RepID=A0A7K1XW68_9SPHI|nr:CaiB/BaiF CoA-transferase family protein [Hufsiella ginkgonis]MXV15220.1 CoA transferase [Hufsiella ginkgonis]
MTKPLEGIVMLEFCQFMAGPSAGLKLADLGARVIKIERPVHGESGRQIAIKNIFIEGNSLVFHTINRNKESYAADLKNPADLAMVKKLIAHADIITHNFRAGVMEKLGLDYGSAKAINPRIVYGVVTGYGNNGPWALKPGQDLLVQSLSGLTYLSGTRNDGPVPFGLAVTDIFCGAHFAQGLLAALLKRAKTNKSVLVEVSLLESALDMQFEVITTYLNDGGKLPMRGAANGTGHAYLNAPYGVYRTKDSYLAMAMGDLPAIGDAIGCKITVLFPDPARWFGQRDDIAKHIADCLREQTTSYWVALLESLKIWCSAVFNYRDVLEHEGYKSLEMAQEVQLSGDNTLTTTRCPIRINRQKIYSPVAAPLAGADTDSINHEFNLTTHETT